MKRSAQAPVDRVEDHGGDLAGAARRFPDALEPWLDLSTGINPHSYPLGDLPASAFARLPDEARLAALIESATRYYGAPASETVVAAPGTQILLPLVAGLIAPGRAAILAPTYAEHRRAALLAGHRVTETSQFTDLAEADIAFVVNPNNPDGRILARDEMTALAAAMRNRNGLLVVDEAFMDVGPDASLAGEVEAGGVVVLRSFGKFFGLAGLRLGFAVADRTTAARLSAILGPWAVSGPAIEIGLTALRDRSWQEAMRKRLADDAARLDAILKRHGLDIVGGTSLFRLARSAKAAELFGVLGRAGILVRPFDHDPDILRFGLPGNDAAFHRLDTALAVSRQGKDYGP